jgi:two-component system, cell cycle response regulator CpdR
MNVLYVEDSHDVRELVCLMLEEEGLRVVACASAESAEIEFARSRFEVLITDVSLPSALGTVLARRLQCGRPDLWVVFCSGYSMKEGLAAWGPRARSLVKPFEQEELHALVEEFRAAAI